MYHYKTKRFCCISKYISRAKFQNNFTALCIEFSLSLHLSEAGLELGTEVKIKIVEKLHCNHLLMLHKCPLSNFAL
jgi:hypothetical protein